MKNPKYYRRFNYDRKLLPNSHLSRLEEGVETIDDAKLQSGYTTGYPGWGLLYHILLSHLNPDGREFIIETGSNWGCTTIVLAQALVDSGARGSVFSFEIDKENYERAKQNISAAGLTNRVELYLGDSITELRPALRDLSGVRFAFLDASHLYEDVKAEFETILPHLSNDALVIFDNTYGISEGDEDKRVNGFLHDIRSQFGGNLINLEFVSWYTPGLAIWQRSPNI